MTVTIPTWRTIC